MHRAHSLSIGLLLVALCWAPCRVQAQIPVIDAANLVANEFTGLQTFLNLLQAVLQTGYMVLELTPYDSTGLDGGFDADLAELDAIVRDATQVLYDIGAVEQQSRALFGLDAAPSSTAELQARLFEIRRVRAEQLMQARRVQTLQHRAVQTVAHIATLLSRIVDFIGQKQAMQNINASLTVLKQLENKQGVQIAAFQQAILTEQQEQPLIDESLFLIKREVMADWPRP
jgi:hypothetical protein